MWRVRKRLFCQLSLQEIGFFDCVRTGELMNRLSEVHSAHPKQSLCTDKTEKNLALYMDKFRRSCPHWHYISLAHLLLTLLPCSCFVGKACSVVALVLS